MIEPILVDQCFAVNHRVFYPDPSVQLSGCPAIIPMNPHKSMFHGTSWNISCWSKPPKTPPGSFLRDGEAVITAKISEENPGHVGVRRGPSGLVGGSPNLQRVGAHAMFSARFTHGFKKQVSIGRAPKTCWWLHAKIEGTTESPRRKAACELQNDAEIEQK